MFTLGAVADIALGLLAGLGLIALWTGLRDVFRSPPRRLARPFLSLLLILRNQAAVTEWLVRQLGSLNGRLSYEIVAVDDRSSDDTGAILERLALRLPQLKVLRVTESEAMTRGALELGHVMCQSPLVLLLTPGHGVRPEVMMAQVRALLDQAGALMDAPRRLDQPGT